MKGFSLIEVVVALTVLAAGLVMVQRLTGQAAVGAHAAADRITAVFLAEAVLAEARTAEALSPGITEGVGPAGGAWRLSISPFGAPSVAGDVVWRLVVDAGPARQSRPVRLETLVIAPVERLGDGR